VRIAGRAAHAGVEPQKGISATQSSPSDLALHALNDYASGTTVNVGVVHAGTRPNVVAAQAEAHVDVRVQTLAEQRASTPPSAACSRTCSGRRLLSMAA